MSEKHYYQNSKNEKKPKHRRKAILLFQKLLTEFQKKLLDVESTNVEGFPIVIVGKDHDISFTYDPSEKTLKSISSDCPHNVVNCASLMIIKAFSNESFHIKSESLIVEKKSIKWKGVLSKGKSVSFHKETDNCWFLASEILNTWDFEVMFYATSYQINTDYGAFVEIQFKIQPPFEILVQP